MIIWLSECIATESERTTASASISGSIEVSRTSWCIHRTASASSCRL